MVYDLKTFTKVNQADKRYLILIIGQKNVIRNGNQCRLGGVAGTEAVLNVREEVVGSEVEVQLTLHHTLNYLGNDRDDGYGSGVGGIGRIAGFMDGISKGMFPFHGNVTSCEARVHYMEKDRADHRQTHLDDTNADAI